MEARIDGVSWQALFAQAMEHRAAGRLDAAAALLGRAIAVNDAVAACHFELGRVFGALQRHAEALACYERAIALQPGHGAALANHGNALRRLGRPREALASFARALAVLPEHPEVLNNQGTALRDLERFEAALASYDRVLAVRPGWVEALCNRAAVLGELDRPAEALAGYEQALSLRPDHAEAHANKGVLLSQLGRAEAANAATEMAIRCAPRRARYYYNLAIGRRLDADDPYFAAMRGLAAAPLDDEERMFLQFALGRALGDQGDHAAAFRHLLDGNALKRRRTVYDEAATLGALAHSRALFSDDVMRRLEGAGAPSDVPVFIVGMPRSGSTLVEQVLASHPAVLGVGESSGFERALRRVRGAGSVALSAEGLRGLGADYLASLPTRAGVLRVVDKTLENFRFLGFIRLALPGARIVHVRRDPVDLCVSCFSHLFKQLPYTYELGELGRYYRAYAALMAHWREVLPAGAMLEVAYEDVVNDVEAQARRIVAHCGLAWDARCLAFYRTERTVRTASQHQVRQPIYRHAVGKWERYGDALAPLLAELREAIAG